MSSLYKVKTWLSKPPLRVDSSYLPAWLFDHALLLGATDESEDSESEESEE